LERKKDHIPIIIAGDFNEIPTNPVCQYFAEGHFKEILNIPKHPLQLENSYNHYDNTKVAPYTTFKKRDKEVCRTIDYIWYTSDKLHVTHLLEIPLIEELKNRLPCSEYPSDHLALISFFDAY